MNNPTLPGEGPEDSPPFPERGSIDSPPLFEEGPEDSPVSSVERPDNSPPLPMIILLFLGRDKRAILPSPGETRGQSSSKERLEDSLSFPKEKSKDSPHSPGAIRGMSSPRCGGIKELSYLLRRNQTKSPLSEEVLEDGPPLLEVGPEDSPLLLEEGSEESPLLPKEGSDGCSKEGPEDRFPLPEKGT